jgi:hypothetical protein
MTFKPLKQFKTSKWRNRLIQDFAVPSSDGLSDLPDWNNLNV